MNNEYDDNEGKFRFIEMIIVDPYKNSIQPIGNSLLIRWDNYYSRITSFYNYFSRAINIFHDRRAPENGTLVGYGAIIESLDLPLPLPNTLAIISEKRRQYETTGWIVLTPRYKPLDTLFNNLVFSLKYEGINLLFFKKLFEAVDEVVIEELVKKEPLSQFSRKIWFLYEWLTQKKLNLPDLKEGN